MELKVGNISKIQVKELLNRHSYELNLEPLTILHGFNGSGKTTFLKIIHSILTKNYRTALDCKFKSISFIFDKNEKVIFTNIHSKDLKCEIKDSKGKTTIKGNLIGFDVESIITKFTGPSEFLKHLRKSGYIFARDDDDDFPYIETKTGKILKDLSEAIDHFRETSTYEFEPEIEEYLKELNSFFIQTNRLETTSSITGMEAHPEDRKSRIDKYRHSISRRPVKSHRNPLRYIKEDLLDRIEMVAERSARISREFDSQFFNLLIEELKVKKQRAQDEILKNLETELENIDLQENELIELGLYEGPATETKRARIILEEEGQISTGLLNALLVFSKGLQRKFETFRDIKPKVYKFTDFISSHLSGKELILSRKNGIQFKIHDGTIIEPWMLSSGEQHIVLIAYFFVFLAPEKSIVLIDEPEISLHAKWQEKFLEDMLELSKQSNLRFIVATHSPSIISKFRDHMLLLEVPTLNES